MDVLNKSVSIGQDSRIKNSDNEYVNQISWLRQPCLFNDDPVRFERDVTIKNANLDVTGLTTMSFLEISNNVDVMDKITTDTIEASNYTKNTIPLIHFRDLPFGVLQNPNSQSNQTDNVQENQVVDVVTLNNFQPLLNKQFESYMIPISTRIIYGLRYIGDIDYKFKINVSSQVASINMVDTGCKIITHLIIYDIPNGTYEILNMGMSTYKRKYQYPADLSSSHGSNYCINSLKNKAIGLQFQLFESEGDPISLIEQGVYIDASPCSV